MSLRLKPQIANATSRDNTLKYPPPLTVNNPYPTTYQYDNLNETQYSRQSKIKSVLLPNRLPPLRNNTFLLPRNSFSQLDVIPEKQNLKRQKKNFSRIEESELQLNEEFSSMTPKINNYFIDRPTTRSIQKHESQQIDKKSKIFDEIDSLTQKSFTNFDDDSINQSNKWIAASEIWSKPRFGVGAPNPLRTKQDSLLALKKELPLIDARFHSKSEYFNNEPTAAAASPHNLKSFESDFYKRDVVFSQGSRRSKHTNFYDLP